MNNNWLDIISLYFTEFQFSITFYSDGTYFRKGYFGNGSGTYKAFGKTIETYVDGVLFYTYQVHYMRDGKAELTMSKDGRSIEIRVKKK